MTGTAKVEEETKTPVIIPRGKSSIVVLENVEPGTDSLDGTTVQILETLIQKANQ